jgi:hypothetical protein
MYGWDRLLMLLGLVILSWLTVYGICWAIYKTLQWVNDYLDNFVLNPQW